MQYTIFLFSLVFGLFMFQIVIFRGYPVDIVCTLVSLVLIKYLRNKKCQICQVQLIALDNHQELDQNKFKI
jgi:hypothetical protein